MKYITQILICFCVINFVLTQQACKNGSGDLRQKKVDSLAYGLSQIEDKLNIDTDDLGAETRKMEKIYRLLKVKDTGITLEMGIVLEQYLNEIRIFKQVITHKADLQKELAELKKQLKNLNHSLKEEKMTEEEFKKAFAIEKHDIEHLEDMVEEKIEPYLHVQSEHARIAPKIEEYATKFADEKPSR
ncbi:MAG: hypothetical protein SGJ10_13655 [Bacteroidota bacterium]|nr:hypothetical protein [Bacteroidota bacterium]